MDTLQLIKTVKFCLQEWFNHPKGRLFCQVASLSEGKPHVRTMDLYAMTEQGNLTFFTATNTPKWQHCQDNPNLSVCVSNENYGQIIAEGVCTLSSSSNASEELSYYWNHLLDDYWREFYLKHQGAKIIDGIPSSFGVISITPSFWEILEINTSDYKRSRRTQFVNTHEESWESNLVDPV